MYDKSLVLEILDQVLQALEIAKKRCRYAQNPDDFLSSETGLEKLDAICMKLIATGESLKKIDRITNHTLFTQYPDIEWKKIKGIRDFISHHYFDLDAEIIHDICTHHLDPLIATLETVKHDLLDETEK